MFISTTGGNVENFILYDIISFISKAILFLFFSICIFYYTHDAIIGTEFGKENVTILRKWEQLEKKIANFRNHRFTYRCMSQITPKSLKFPNCLCSISTRQLELLLWRAGPTAQHMQDFPIFFIQLNYVYK